MVRSAEVKKFHCAKTTKQSDYNCPPKNGMRFDWPSWHGMGSIGVTSSRAWSLTRSACTKPEMKFGQHLAGVQWQGSLAEASLAMAGSLNKTGTGGKKKQRGKMNKATLLQHNTFLGNTIIFSLLSTLLFYSTEVLLY